MVLDQLVVVLALVAVLGLPAAVFVSLFTVIEYLADEEKIEAFRQARREGRPVDFTSTGRDSDPQYRPGEDETTTCSRCGSKNGTAFDRCWNCQSEL